MSRGRSRRDPGHLPECRSVRLVEDGPVEIQNAMLFGGSRPLLLDLFCGAGGCAMGYHQAGFDVTGVDAKDQPNYPFEFRKGDAIEALEAVLSGDWDAPFVAIHASPPCQAHSTVGKQSRARFDHIEHADFVEPARKRLQETGLPYVIENVVGAPLWAPVTICGSSLGLDVRRHRLFETNWPLMVPPCAHGWQTPRFRSLDKRRGVDASATVVGVHGHINYSGEQALRQAAMGIDWMTPYELTQAIPPAYTELIGHQLMDYLRPTTEAAA